MQSSYWRLKMLFAGRRGQEESNIGWGLVLAIIAAVIAIIFIIWFSRQSGKSVLDLLRDIL